MMFSMFNDTGWTKKGNTEIFLHNAKEVAAATFQADTESQSHASLALLAGARQPCEIVKKKKKPEIQIQTSKFDKISGALWDLLFSESCCSEGRNSCVPKDDFPIHLNHSDVWRKTKISIDVLNEATIADYLNIDGEKSLSEPLIRATRFDWLNKNPPKAQSWVQCRLAKKQVTTRQRFSWPEEWSRLPKHSQRKAINK